MVHDLLNPAVILCKTLQNDDVSVIDAIEALLKTSKTVEKLKTLSFKELPTVKRVLSRIKDDDNIDMITYQSVQLTRYEDGMSFVERHKNEKMESVLACLKNRIRSHHPELLTNALTILVTQRWKKSDDIDFAATKLDDVVQQF